MGYPSLEDERQLLGNTSPAKAIREISPVLSKSDVLDLQQKTLAVKVEPVLVDYILSIITATRESKYLSLGVSPRGGISLQQAAPGRAFLHGRDYCIPDDIKLLAESVLCHRVIPESKHGANKRLVGDTADIIREIVEQTGIPV